MIHIILMGIRTITIAIHLPWDKFGIHISGMIIGDIPSGIIKRGWKIGQWPSRFAVSRGRFPQPFGGHVLAKSPPQLMSGTRRERHLRWGLSKDHVQNNAPTICIVRVSYNAPSLDMATKPPFPVPGRTVLRTNSAWLFRWLFRQTWMVSS